MIGKLDEAFKLHGEALKLRAQRQEMLASNLANADTPHYKAVDFKFSDALRNAVGMPNAQTQAGALARSNGGHLQASGTVASVPVLYRMPTQASVDGNTVDTNVEQAAFGENAVRYEASLRFLNGQIKTLLSAIQG